MLIAIYSLDPHLILSPTNPPPSKTQLHRERKEKNEDLYGIRRTKWGVVVLCCVVLPPPGLLVGGATINTTPQVEPVSKHKPKILWNFLLSDLYRDLVLVLSNLERTGRRGGVVYTRLYMCALKSNGCGVEFLVIYLFLSLGWLWLR